MCLVGRVCVWRAGLIVSLSSVFGFIFQHIKSESKQGVLEFNKFYLCMGIDLYILSNNYFVNDLLSYFENSVESEGLIFSILNRSLFQTGQSGVNGTQWLYMEWNIHIIWL